MEGEGLQCQLLKAPEQMGCATSDDGDEVDKKGDEFVDDQDGDDDL